MVNFRYHDPLIYLFSIEYSIVRFSPDKFSGPSSCSSSARMSFLQSSPVSQEKSTSKQQITRVDTNIPSIQQKSGASLLEQDIRISKDEDDASSYECFNIEMDDLDFSAFSKVWYGSGVVDWEVFG
jgi:hypothetical protein